MVNCPGCGEENPPKFKLCGYCGTPLAAAVATLPVRELRKTVTIVFSDLKGSTAIGERLDAEALHEVKERYFGAMAAEIARHGGKVEKYIGDAIMAVFGLPRTHEDDALRAVRAAFGMQQTLARVNVDLQARYGVALAQRIGVNTGEVVANDDPSADQKLATGDAVNVAARLEQAAPEQQVYIGEVTYRLVRDAVEVEAVEPLELKGKSQRVAAYRVVNVPGLDGNLRRVDTPIVGREAELQRIAAVYHEVVQQSAVRLVTVVGDAGVGKSRLVHEVVSRITAGATVLRGRCLAYGDGITFWPLRAMFGDAGITDDDKPQEAHAKLLSYIGDRDVVDRVMAATGLSRENFPLHEVYWAARKVLELLATRAPVVALIDDIHWAEPAFLDLLEHVLTTSTGAPILLLATSRHDLLEHRAQWGEQPGASRVVLKPLSDEAAAQVVTNLLGSTGLPPDVLARIVDTSEGNPLYVEQLLSMLIDRGALVQSNGRWIRTQAAVDIDVPPTIHALLEARLDQLGRAERATVEPASVMGLEFPQSALAELAPEAVRKSLDEHLATLTRKQFVRLSASVDAITRYRFHHQLVRDTVYNGLLKRARAQLHIDFVRWADRVNAERDRALEFEEINGYHLEQAHGYLRELGPLDATGLAIGLDAARRLSNAARRAFARGDMHAACNLYQRAAALLEREHPNRLAILPNLGEAQLELGDFAAARSVLTEAVELGERASNHRVKVAARLIGMLVQLHAGQQGNWSEEATGVVTESIRLLEGDVADEELAHAWRVMSLVHQNSGRFAEAAQTIERMLGHARRADNQRLARRGALGLAVNALYGPTPVAQAIALSEASLDGAMNDRQVEGMVTAKLALLKAMNGEFDEARALYRKGRAMLDELGESMRAASTAVDLLIIEQLAGDLANAERAVMADYEFFARTGDTYYLSTLAALLARVIRDQGRDAEALAMLSIAEDAAAEDDFDAQALWRSIRAPILARNGDLAVAMELAHAAAELVSRTESPVLQADTLFELATVLRIGGRDHDARATAERAASIYATKGDIVSASRTQQWITQMAKA
ncbi:MAG: AAA family ATPase [Burkholderiaceae bacterium]|nr:AAA family ATPase [Burkholderiaceae bacterium]